MNGDDAFWLIVGLLAIFAFLPTPLAIAICGLIVVVIISPFVDAIISANRKRRAEKAKRDRMDREAQAAAAMRERQANARKKRQQRINALGSKNCRHLEAALASVKLIAASEAAREGWLGEVDFTADIQLVTDIFTKAHSLTKVAEGLSALDNPSTHDREILADARATITKLECAAIERVELIGKCAKEASLIDESLRNEREEARTAEQRAELHAQLSAMLYGIEASPDATHSSSTADAIMARVEAYREIQNQIQRTRD